MKFFTHFLSAAFAVLLTLTPAVAADKVIKSFNEQTLKNVLAAVGATGMETGTAGQDNYTLFTVDGVKYVTALRVCKSGTCEGILIQCSFSGETFSTTTSNSFNQKHVFVNTAVSDDRQTLLLGRYLVSLGGVTEANVTETFKLFFTLPGVLVEQVKKDRATPVASASPQAVPVAVSAAPTASAVSAAALAMQTQPWAEMGPLPVGEKFSNKIAP